MATTNKPRANRFASDSVGILSGPNKGRVIYAADAKGERAKKADARAKKSSKK